MEVLHEFVDTRFVLVNSDDDVTSDKRIHLRRRRYSKIQSKGPNPEGIHKKRDGKYQ
jgi:hypothetical protein